MASSKEVIIAMEYVFSTFKERPHTFKNVGFKTEFGKPRQKSFG
jgi:hypothetical protein